MYVLYEDILALGLLSGFCSRLVSASWLDGASNLRECLDYVQSYTDPVKTDETKQVFPGVVHRQILDDGVLTNILSVSPDAVDIRPYRAMSAAIGTEDLPSIARRNRAPIANKWRFL